MDATRPKTHVKPARVYFHDADLQTERAHGIGFRALCDCGWKSRVTQTFAVARADERAHREWHANPASLSIAGPL